MLEASTRPARVPGWWRRWPAWSPYASGNPLTARIGEAGLAALAIGGGTVTLGLIRPWGEIWPRWVPFLAGRRVPVALPTILGGVAALAITVGGLACYHCRHDQGRAAAGPPLGREAPC